MRNVHCESPPAASEKLSSTSDLVHDVQLVHKWQDRMRKAADAWKRFDVAEAERELQLSMEDATQFRVAHRGVAEPIMVSLLALANLYRQVERYALAEPLLEEGLSILEQAGSHNDQRTLQTLLQLAAIRLELGAPESSKEIYDNVLHRLEAVEKALESGTLLRFWSDGSRDDSFWLLAAGQKPNDTDKLSDLFDTSLLKRQETFSLLKRQVSWRQEQDALLDLRASCLLSASRVEVMLGRFPEAEAHLRMLERLIQQRWSPLSPRLVTPYVELARMLLASNRLEDARAMCAMAMQRVQRPRYRLPIEKLQEEIDVALAQGR